MLHFHILQSIKKKYRISQDLTKIENQNHLLGVSPSIVSGVPIKRFILVLLA